MQNFAPERWPCGDVDLGLKDTDASPTKQFIESSGEATPFWQHAFGKRPSEALFDLSTDRDCVKNLANDPAYRDKAQLLQKTLMAELKRQDDPRVLGQGDVFDQYDSPRSKAVQTKEAPTEAKAKQQAKAKAKREKAAIQN